MEQPTFDELVNRVAQCRDEVSELDRQINNLQCRRKEAAQRLYRAQRHVRYVLGMDDATDDLAQAPLD